MITDFQEVFEYLRASGICKRLVAAWANDSHTIEAISRAVEEGLVRATLVGDEDLIKDACAKSAIDPGRFTIVDERDELKAVALAVKKVHEGEGDILMKGLCSTDKFLRAVLDKEGGLVPQKGVLSHVGVIENPRYRKLLFVSDIAVIPQPDFRQKAAMTRYVTSVARSFGIKTPKVAFIAASEQVLDSMSACMEAAALAKMCDHGQVGPCTGDGPLALDVALDREAARIKHLDSPVAGDADCLVFPNIESANVFWKCNSRLCEGVRMAGMLVGTTAPCILASRADSSDTKFCSIMEALMSLT